jgi:hypothetical protein
VGNLPFDVESWNDKLGRTKDEVLTLFDKAIAAQLGIPQP